MRCIIVVNGNQTVSDPFFSSILFSSLSVVASEPNNTILIREKREINIFHVYQLPECVRERTLFSAFPKPKNEIQAALSIKLNGSQIIVNNAVHWETNQRYFTLCSS